MNDATENEILRRLYIEEESCLEVINGDRQDLAAVSFAWETLAQVRADIERYS